MEKKVKRMFSVLQVMALICMTIVPLVSAEECIQKAEFDAKNYPLPQLEMDPSIEITNITGELSPVSTQKGNDRSTFGIPVGSIIQHSKDGITRVYTQNGKQILCAIDNQSLIIPTSAGSYKPATFIHTVPCDSHVHHVDNRTYVLDTENRLILAIINEHYNDSLTAERGILYHEWIEYTEVESIDEVTQFDAYWRVPSPPPSSESWEAMYLFNGLNPHGGGYGIIQPVLEWNRPNTGLYWTGAAWGAHPGEEVDDIGSRIHVNTGDYLKGRIYWSENYNQWYIQLSDLTTGQSSSIYTDLFPWTTNMDASVALEGYEFDDDSDVPGDTKFYNMEFRNHGNPINVRFGIGHYGNRAIQKLTELDVNIISNPSEVKLHTAN